MKRYPVVLFVLLAAGFRLAAQDLGLYKKEYYIVGKDTLPYRILLPVNYDASTKYPLIYFLHGSGERGNDNEKQLVHGGKLFLTEDNRRDYPAIVVFPQCPQNSSWTNVSFKRAADGNRQFNFMSDTPVTRAMVMAQGLVKQLLSSYPVKKKQVYVAGLSMGGMGTFEIVRRNPSLFAAAIPICGGGNTDVKRKMKKVDWWIFHGAKDASVPVALSEQMHEALLNAGAKAKLTIYPEATHNSWDSAFAEKELLPWLFSQRK